MSGVTPYVELVHAVAARLGAGNARQLADKLGMTGRDEDKSVRNWWNGVNAPNYEATMRLLGAAGWLNMSEAAPPVPRPPVDPLEQLGENTAELLQGQKDVMTELAAIRAALATQPEASQTSPKPSRGAQ